MRNIVIGSVTLVSSGHAGGGRREAWILRCAGDRARPGAGA